MERNISVIKDVNGNQIVMVNDIRFKGKRNIDWDEVEQYLKQYVGEFIEIAESKEKLAEWLCENPMTYTDGKSYSVTAEKQSLLNSNLASYERAKAAGITYPLKWNASGEECTAWTYEELVALSLSIAAYVAPRVSKQQEIEILINACTAADELDSIEVSYE